MFSSIEDVVERFAKNNYIASRRIATVIYLATELRKPILVEGPAGVGKTDLAKVLAASLGFEMIRLQCYEGLDEGKALYEWEYAKQLLYTQILKDKISEDGFLAFAKALPSPQIYEAIKDAERLTDITHHRFPTSVRRHYERLPALPDNFLLVGDAVASFNPVYGQGMSSAALQADALQQILRERAAQYGGLAGLSSAFFQKTADAIDAPWTLAANSDFAYPETTGERPAGLAEGTRYFMAMDKQVAEDIEVQRLMTEVFQLTKPLSALVEEPLRSRVMARL